MWPEGARQITEMYEIYVAVTNLWNSRLCTYLPPTVVKNWRLAGLDLSNHTTACELPRPCLGEKAVEPREIYHVIKHLAYTLIDITAFGKSVSRQS